MIFNKLKSVFMTIVLCSSVLVGCSDRKGEDLLSGNITAVGSSALQPLVEVAAESFSQDYPDISINVQGGGSGLGLSQISQGTVEIGNSDVFAEEKGINSSNIIDNRVCVVGISPIVNKNIGIDNVTKKELIDIFSGKIKNWKEIGGKDIEVVVINRAEGSGTRYAFEKYGLDGNKSIKAQEQDNSGSVKKIVSQTPGAISYVSFSYFDKSIKPLKIDGIEPNIENISDNSWKIWSYEHMYIKKNANEITKKFMDYMMSDKVQKNLVDNMGYMSIKEMKVERKLDGRVESI